MSVLFTIRSDEHLLVRFLFFFFNDTATTEIYTLSLHDALPIFNETLRSMRTSTLGWPPAGLAALGFTLFAPAGASSANRAMLRSEEHTSELQSQSNLVCRLLLEKKKKLIHLNIYTETFTAHNPS